MNSFISLENEYLKIEIDVSFGGKIGKNPVVRARLAELSFEMFLPITMHYRQARVELPAAQK